MTAAPRPPQQVVTGAGSVPIDPYDAIDLLAVRADEPSQLLAWAARQVADLWNDPPVMLAQRDAVAANFPELAAALDELLGGGPGDITVHDIRPIGDSPDRPEALPTPETLARLQEKYGAGGAT